MDIGRARRNHDWRDMRKIMEWFVVHDPFEGTVPQLRSLASGLTAREGDGINCDDTEKVGEAIQRSMDGKSVSEATMKRSLAIHTLCCSHTVANILANVKKNIRGKFARKWRI